MAIPPLKFQVQIVTTQAQQAVTNLKKYLEILEKQFKAVDKAKNPDQWKRLDKEIRSVNSSIKNLSSTMTQLNNTGKNTSNTFMNITRYFTSFLLVQKLVTGIREATRAFIEFQKTIAMNRALIQGSNQDMKEMQQQALDLGKTTIFTANQVAELQTQLIKLGVTSTDALRQMTEAVVNLASAAGEDLATAGEVVYSVLNQYQIDAKHSTELTDIMSKALVESAMDLNSLAYSLKYAGTSANMLGLTVAQTTAMLELLSSVGIKGSSAGTSLNAMFIEMTKSSSKLTKETGIVVKSFDDIIKTFEVLDEKGIGAAKMFDLLNIRAARAAGNMTDPQMLKKLDLFLAGLGDPNTIKRLNEEYENLAALKLDPVKDAVAVERLKDLTEALYETNAAGEILMNGNEKVQKSLNGYAAETASQSINSVAGDLQLLTSNLTNLGIELLNSKNGPIRDFVQGINEVVNGLRVFITGVGESSEKIQKWIGIIYEVAKAWLAFYAASKFTQFATWASAGVSSIKTLGAALGVLGGKLKTAALTTKLTTTSIKGSLLSVGLAWKAFWTTIKASNPIGWVLLLLDAFILAGKALVKLFTDAEKAKARAERKQNREDVNGMISDYQKINKANQDNFKIYKDLSDRQLETLKTNLQQEMDLREDLDAKLRSLAVDKLKDDKAFQDWFELYSKQKTEKLLEKEQEAYDAGKAINEKKLNDAIEFQKKELKITEDYTKLKIDDALSSYKIIDDQLRKRKPYVPFYNADGSINPENIDPNTGQPGSTPTTSTKKPVGTGGFDSPGLGLNENKKWEDDMMRLLDAEAKIAEARRQAKKESDLLVADAYNKRKAYYDYEVKLINLVITDVTERKDELLKLRVKYEELYKDYNVNLDTASAERRRIAEKEIKNTADDEQQKLDIIKKGISDRQKAFETQRINDEARTAVPVSELDRQGVVGQVTIQRKEILAELDETNAQIKASFISSQEEILINEQKMTDEINQEYLTREKDLQNILNTQLNAHKDNLDLQKELQLQYDIEIDTLRSEKSDKLIENQTNTAKKLEEINKISINSTSTAFEQATAKLNLNAKETDNYIRELMTTYEEVMNRLENDTKRGPNVKGKLNTLDISTQGQTADVDKKFAEDLKVLGSAKMKELGLFEMYEDQKTAILKKAQKERDDIILQGISEYVGMVQESIGILSEIYSTQKQSEQDAIDDRYESEIRAAEQRQETLIQQYGLKNKKEEQMTAAQKRKLEKINLQAEEAREKAEKEKEQRSLDLKKKYANKEFAIQIANIITNSALSIMKLWANPGFPLAIPMTVLVGALAITQIAAAKKQKDSVQNLATGGEVYGPSHSNGGVPVELEGGEIVINKRSSSLPWVKNLALGLNAIGNNKVSTGRIMADGGQVRTSSASQVSAVSEETLRIIVQEVVAGTSAIPIVNTALDTTNLSDSVKKVRNRTTW